MNQEPPSPQKEKNYIMLKKGDYTQHGDEYQIYEGGKWHHMLHPGDMILEDGLKFRREI